VPTDVQHEAGCHVGLLLAELLIRVFTMSKRKTGLTTADAERLTGSPEAGATAWPCPHSRKIRYVVSFHHRA